MPKIGIIATLAALCLFLAGCTTTTAPLPNAQHASAAPCVHNDPVDSYTAHTVHGWTVRISKRLNATPEIRDQCFADVSNQLYRISTLLPPDTVSKLQQTDVWLEHNFPRRAQYHQSTEWLKKNGYNTAKHKTVEIPSAELFLEWRNEAVMTLLHELFHAYHHQVIGFDDKRIINAYRRAKKSGQYEKIMRVNGVHEKHYAMETPQEFFAEMSEAYLFVNDYYPFVRGELKACDPKTYQLMQEIWSTPTKQ